MSGRLQVGIALVAASLVTGCGLVAEERYVFNEDHPPRWVVIAFGQVNCAPLSQKGRSVEIAVPLSGFVCTSSPPFGADSWSREVVLLRRSDGTSERLDPAEAIQGMAFQHLDVQDCKVEFRFFWYGSRTLAKGRPEDIIAAYVPGCRDL